MILYDGVSPIAFTTIGTKTRDEMLADDWLKRIVCEPTVLYDDGAGSVYSFEYLETAAHRQGVLMGDDVQACFEETKAKFDGTYKAPGVAEAQATADEAKAIAEQAGTDPQLQALATLQVSTMSFDSTPSDEVVKFINYWPDWKPDTAYKHNDPLTYGGKYWRVSKDLTSQKIYPPGTAESEYYPVELAPDGIIIFHQPGGAYNAIQKGEKRHYPDADGPVYEALETTSYSPDAYPQHWKMVE